MSLLRVLALALFASAALLLGPAPAASAEAEGVIEGRLVNGTADAAPPVGARVSLYAVRDMDMVGHQSQDVGEGAAFRFEGLDTEPGLVYLLVAEYHDVAYPHPQLLRLDEQSVHQVEATVFETTSDPSGILFERANILLASVTQDEVVVMEMGAVSNRGDRTYVGDEQGVLRLRVPAGAIDILPQAGLVEADTVATEEGLVTHRPVPPGQYQIALSYAIPVEGSVLDLSKVFEYPVHLFSLYLPQMGLTASSPELQLQGGAPVEMGGRAFQVYHGQDLVAGAQLSIRVAGLPSAVWEPSPELIAGAILAGTALLGTFAALFLVLRRRRNAGPVATEDDGPRSTVHGLPSNPLEREHAELVLQLAELDERLKAGELSDEQHRQQRAERKERLVAVTRRLMVESEA